MPEGLALAFGCRGSRVTKVRGFGPSVYSDSWEDVGSRSSIAILEATSVTSPSTLSFYFEGHSSFWQVLYLGRLENNHGRMWNACLNFRPRPAHNIRHISCNLSPNLNHEPPAPTSYAISSSILLKMLGWVVAQ